MGDYFDSNGKLTVRITEVFDDDGSLWHSVYREAHSLLETVPATSDAVRLFFAEEYASETSGNYATDLLYFRAYP